MLNQEKIGKFIATLRKEEKHMTQEELAEKLGVSNRSVSRWENGKTMPDLAMLPMISEELGVSVSELLEGERLKTNPNEIENIGRVIELSSEERKRKAKKINTYFFIGLICILIVILEGQFKILNFIGDVRGRNFLLGLLTGLGITFEIVGFYYNSKERKYTEREIHIMSSDERVAAMRTAGEMLQFAKKSQKADFRQYERAFETIEGKLKPEETVIFSMVAESYTENEMSGGLWHLAIAVTGERLLLGGEKITGRVMTRYGVDEFALSDILAVEKNNRQITVKTKRTVLKIEGENLSQVFEYFKKAIGK